MSFLSLPAEFALDQLNSLDNAIVPKLIRHEVVGRGVTHRACQFSQSKAASNICMSVKQPGRMLIHFMLIFVDINICCSGRKAKYRSYPSLPYDSASRHYATPQEAKQRKKKPPQRRSLPLALPFCIRFVCQQGPMWIRIIISIIAIF